jgi:hypothetical protein
MSSKTLAQLITEIATNFPDNSAGAITAALLRTTVGDLAQSSQILLNDAFIVVRTTGDATANGAALLTAYTAAKALTPNGNPVDSDNRATLFLPPGFYDVGATPFIMDGEGVNVVSVAGHYKSVYLKSDAPCQLATSSVLVKGISFRPRGDDSTPGIIIADGVGPCEMDFVQSWPPGDGMEIQVGDGSGTAVVKVTNSTIDFGLVDGTLISAVTIDSTIIGTSVPQPGKFTNLTGNGTALGSVAVRPSNNQTDAATITKIAKGFADLNFGSIGAGASADLTIAVNGAIFDGVYAIPVLIGFANAPEPGLVFFAFVSATNTVTIRASNITVLPIDPATNTYSVMILRMTPPS